MKIDTRKRFTLRIPKELLDFVREEAKQKDICINAMILSILQDWIENQN